MVALIALFASIVLLFAIKPLMLQLSFAQILRWDLAANYFIYGIFLVFAVGVGILAGFFPAVVLSDCTGKSVLGLPLIICPTPLHYDLMS